MIIPGLGPLQLHSNPGIPVNHPWFQRFQWFESAPVSVPYFDGLPLKFTLQGLTEEDTGDVQSAVEAFLALDSSARLAASPRVFQNYQHILDEAGEDLVDCRIATPEAVWEFVRPRDIFVSRRQRHDRLIYVRIAARCEWETEHGLQLSYRQGSELARVSDQDGHLTDSDAYNLPEGQDRIVS